MKRIVQRLALAFLLLLPMLANAQVTTTATAKYGARGTVEVKGHNATIYDTVVTVVNTGYFIDNGASWLNGTTVLDPGTSAGTLPVENPTANTYWLILDKDQTWNIIVKHLPTYPEVTFTATHGSVQDGKETPYGAITSPQAYAYGTHVYLHAIPATSYTFGAWLKSAAVDADTLSANADIDFYIFDDTTFYPSFDPAQYKITITLTPQNSAPLTAAFSSIELYDGMTEIVTYSGDDLTQANEITLPYDKNVDIYATTTSNYKTDVNWSVDGTPVATADNYTLPVRTADMAVTITAVPKDYTVTIDNDDDYFGTVSPAGGNSWAYGSLYTLTADVNDPSFQFVEWKENGTTISTDASFNYLVTGNKTVTAYWDYATFPVTLTADPTDKGTFTIDAVAYNPATEYSFGTNHTVVAAPADGYHFVQWSDNGSTNATRDITIATTNSYIAEFGTESYAVSFADNGYAGYLTLTGNANYDYNTTATVVATPVDADKYIFKEWQVSGTQVSTSASYEFTVTEAVVLTAVWEPVSYTITVTSVDDNEGTAVATATSVDYDDDFTVTATPTYGHVFKSWTTSGFGDVTTNPFTHAVDIANAAHEHTFVANFGPDEYDITVDMDVATHATSVSGAATGVSYGAERTVSVTPDPAKTFLEFKGWKNENDDTVSTATSFTFNVTGDTTFIALFDTVAYDVTASVAAGEGTVTNSVSAKYGRTVTLTAAPATGWHVLAWSNAATTDAINVTVAATAAENTYTVSFEHDPVTITMTTDPVDILSQAAPYFMPDPAVYGEEIVLGTTIPEGYTFTNWTKGSSEPVADAGHVLVDGDATYTAHFTINTYTIDVTVNDNAMGVATIDGAATATAEYHSAIDTRVAATANPGYTFVKWQANGVDIADITTWEVPAMPTLDDHIALTAVFDYNLLDVTGHALDSVATTGGAGTDLSANDAAFVITGSKIIGGIVTTTAPAITGWHFVNWLNEPYAAKATVNPRKDTLTSADPLLLTAVYAIDSFTVALVSNYGEDVEFTGAGRYAYGTDATINATVATAKADSLEFIKWGASDASTDRPRTVNVVSDTTFTPVFGVIEYTVNATTDGNGTITAPATLPVDVAYGQTTTITAAANHGYELVNWTNNVNTDELTSLTISPKITGDVTWTANFQKTDYTVTAVVKDMAGNVQPTMAIVTGAGDYEFEETATLSYTANDGFTFVKWIGEGMGQEATTASITFSVNNDTTIIAQFDTLTTTVTADVDDAAHGSVAVSNASPKYYTQDTLTVTENPGYEFKYWSDDNTITDNPRVIEVTFGTTHSYTAVFEPIQYTVTVATNDETMGSVIITGADKDTVIDYNETIEVVATANTGYSFVSWSDAGAATHDYTLTTANNVTLTATFAPNTNDLTIQTSNFYRGGVRFGTTGDSLATATQNDVAFNESTHIEALPAYGYVFTGWSDGDENAVRDYTFTTDDDVTLTANFDYRPYTIKVNVNEAALATIELNGTEVASGDETQFGYTEHVTVTVTPVANYHIVNGATPYTNASPLSFGVDVLENLEYNYTIVPDTFNVEFVAGVNGSITNFTNGEFAYGEVISGVTAVADANYHFINWSTGATTEIHPDTTVRSDISITANFSIDDHTLTVTSEDATNKGTVTASVTSAAHGTSVTVTATPLTGYTFDSWTDDNNNDAVVAGAAASYTFNLDSNTALTAHFANEAYDLTVSTFTPERGWISVVDGNAVETKDETGATFTVNDLPTHTDITVTATANTGYHFVEWNDDATAPAQRTIQLTKDTSITATFAYDTYTVNWNPNIAARGDVETLGTVAFHFGAVDTLKANPAAGYIFQKWEDGSTVNPRYYTVNGDADLTAIFIYDTIYTDTTKCDSFVWNGHTYTVTEVAAPATLTDAEGYDSIVVLTVNINYSNTEDTVATVCDGFEWHGENRTATGDYEFVMAAANQYGCDSTITLHLTINQHQDSEETVAECESYDWTVNGQTYTESGDYTSPITDANNCDATAILHLTINQPTAGTDVQEHCDSYTWIDAVTYTESTNVPSVVLPAANQYGCDSTVTLNLTINHSSGDKYEQTKCDTYTWTIGGNSNTYTASGVYTFGYINSSNCYQVDTLDLTINYSANTVDVQEACDSYLWPANNTTYTASNSTAVANLQTVNNCDSTVTLNLTINNNSNTTREAQVACDELNYTWEADGQTELFTASGTYTHDYVNAAGCPSTDQVKVTIYQHEDIEDSIVACNSYDWTVNGETYTESGTYTEEIFDDNNCVATATLNLTISESNTGIDEQHACNTFTWIDNVTYTESNNTATKTLTNVAGCDSVVTLNLTVTYNQDVEIYDSGCESYEWNGLTFTTSRDVVYTTTDQFGCDSVTTLHLTINQPTAGEFTDSAYGLYIWNGETYQTDGDYQQTLTDGNGCDSVVTLHLTILLPENPYLYDTACVSYTWEANGMTYTESGAYNDTIRSLVNGEDSIITTLYLLINEPVNPEPVDIAACGAYTWHGTVYDVAGTYTFDTIDAHNCAITETINLTINTAVDPDAVEVIACDSYDWHGERTASGTYTFDTVDANGCAITETLNLTINESQNVTLPEVVACESYEWNGHTYTASGDLSYTTTDVNGCDSTTTLSLYVTYGTHNTVSAEACGSYTWNDSTYTATGVYTYSYLNVDQCESVDTLNLTINEAQTVALPAVTACDSYEWNGVTYTASQDLSVTVPGVNGCDSTTTLALTINQHQDTVENITACDTYTWTANNQTYTTGGTYTAAITDANGCAATGTLNLTVNQHQDSQVSASACDTYTWNGSTYTTSGTYTTPITDANGCAATATLTLTVNQSVTNAIALSDTGSVTYNNVTYTADTVVTVTYTAANGCDSTVTATITVIPEVVAPDSVFVYVGVNYPAHGTVNPSTYANYAIGETVTATATPDSGYMFAYWLVGYINAAGTLYDTLYTNPFSYVLTADDTNYSIIAFAAEFESISGAEDSMTVILATADAAMGTTNPVPGTYRIAEGDSIIFSAVANTGYQFLYWIRETQYTTSSDIYVDTIFGETRQIDGLAWLMETTATYTAYFQVDTNYVPDTIYHFVTLMTANATMGTVSASDSVMDGAEFTATAYPNDGYHFVAWTNGGVLMSNDNPYTFTVNADITLTATFEADPVDTVYYNVTVNYDATMGTVTGAGTYIEGDIVTLQATPNTGYHFVGWYDANDQLLTTVSSYTFTVSANVTFNAQFAADPVYYTVNATANDPAMGSVEGAGQYVAGVTVSLTAQANEGYHFVSWSNGETTPTISFTVTCDTTFVATFAPNDTPQAIDETDMSNVTIYSADSRIIIRGAEGMDVNVYDINGRTINTQMNAGETVEFRMATTGVYLVKVGNAPAKRVLVVR